VPEQKSQLSLYQRRPENRVWGRKMRSAWIRGNRACSYVKKGARRSGRRSR